MIQDQMTTYLAGIEVGDLQAGEVEEMLGVVVRGMQDNPSIVAAFGGEQARRRRSLRRLFGAMARDANHLHNMMVARDSGGAIVGACGAMPPGKCQPTADKTLQMVPTLLLLGPRTAGRTMRWLGAWGRQDPAERHWHLGPVAVDAHLQGMGIGSMLMSVFCARMDAAGEAAYLETDKPINVSFYERFGFETTAEESVLGTPNWFMTRRARER
jgi:ribosomal protein S18 acetylase RimI-like enzyme